MKTRLSLLWFVLLSGSLAACTAVRFNPGGQSVTPSGNIITESRTVGAFTGVDMRTIGKVTLTQGEPEALTVTGSDNIVELITTRVSGDVLIIEMRENVNIEGLNTADLLSFAITAKDLTRLEVSGLASVEMKSLSTSSLQLEMSGAGGIKLDDLTAEAVTVNVNGAGGITLAGTAERVNVDISGAGGVIAGDLKCQTARANLSGVGSATLWVTDELAGTISGVGNVRYYGDPRTNTNATGLGKFQQLGDK